MADETLGWRDWAWIGSFLGAALVAMSAAALWPRDESQTILIFGTSQAVATAPERVAALGGRVLRIDPARRQALAIFEAMPGPLALRRQGVVMALNASGAFGCSAEWPRPAPRAKDRADA